MRLNIRLIGVLFGIMVMGIVGRRLMLHGGMSRNSRDGVAMFLVVALVAIVIGYIGLLFGRMLKAGISRTTEALRSEERRVRTACASTVRSRRYPFHQKK